MVFLLLTYIQSLYPKNRIIMIEETFFHMLISGENAKFTLRSKIINDRIYYYANVVGTDLNIYKNLSQKEQQECIGIEVTDGNYNTVYYNDKLKLKIDLIELYGGVNSLKSEI